MRSESTKPVGFWVRWVLANAAGLAMGLFLREIVDVVLLRMGGSRLLDLLLHGPRVFYIGFGAVLGAIVGVTIGKMQGLVLRRYSNRIENWSLVSLLSGMFTFGMMTAVYGVTGLVVFYPDTAFVAGAIAGGYLGLAQWVLLRRQLRYAAAWIPLSAFAWGIGAVIAIHILSIGGELTLLIAIELTPVFGFLLGTFASAVYGAITGLGLLWLMRQRFPFTLTPATRNLTSALVIIAIILFVVLYAPLLSFTGNTTTEYLKSLTPTPTPGIPGVVLHGEGPFEPVWKAIGASLPLAGPIRLTLDQEGKVYVLDEQNKRLYKFDENGHYLDSWGSDNRRNFFLEEPYDLSLDRDGNIYVVDWQSRINKFDPNGSFVTSWNLTGAGEKRSSHPQSIAISQDRKVYVTAKDTPQILVFDTNGKFLTKWGQAGTKDGEFKSPYALALDLDGNLYVGDPGRNDIQKFDRNGQFLTKFSGCAGTIAIDRTGSVYATRGNTICKFDNRGKLLFEWAGASYADELLAASGIAVDSEGNLYVSDYTRRQVQKLRQHPENQIQFVSQITGDPNPLLRPTGLAVDHQHNLYVVDQGHKRIQKFDADGRFVTMWGEPGSSDGQFNFSDGEPKYDSAVTGIAVDAQGNVYVTDTGNARIQKFDSNGRFLSKWGTRGYADDQFVSPIAISLDRQGNIYVVDTPNFTVDDRKFRILKFDPNGTFLLKWGSKGYGPGLNRYPGGIQVDSGGDVLIADTDGVPVQKFDPTGRFIEPLVGRDSDVAHVAVVYGFTLDRQDNIYLSDSDNYVLKFDPHGKILARWQSNVKGPAALVADSDGFIYVADKENNRIQKFKAASSTSR